MLKRMTAVCNMVFTVDLFCDGNNASAVSNVFFRDTLNILSCDINIYIIFQLCDCVLQERLKSVLIKCFAGFFYLKVLHYGTKTTQLQRGADSPPLTSSLKRLHMTLA